jgi:hypothetical protein
VGLRYIDVDSAEVQQFPEVVKAIGERRPVPLVVVGDRVKSPPVISFAWVVNELRELGVLD